MSLIENINTEGRVLVVEDEAFIATQLEHLLRGFGFQTIEICLSYDEAEELIMLGGFDLVVFDIVIRGKMSFSLIGEAVEQGCAVVTTSGYLAGQEGLEDTAFIAKPVREAALAGTIVKAQEKVFQRGSARKLKMVGSL